MVVKAIKNTELKKFSNCIANILNGSHFEFKLNAGGEGLWNENIEEKHQNILARPRRPTLGCIPIDYRANRNKFN